MQYFHVRQHDNAGLLLAKGGCTFAMIEEPDKGRLRWGVCKCHEEFDAFCKETGRTKAAGRAVSEKFVFFSPEFDEEKQILFVQNLAYYMFVGHESMPTEVLIAAAIEKTNMSETASSLFKILRKKPRELKST